MRIRVTTPNVLRALRKHDSGAAKPYNFALSPILVDPIPNCTLVAPASKHPEEWLTRDYTEANTGKTVKLSTSYNGKPLIPQTISHVLWRHYRHPEDKSLAPNGELCSAHSKGLLQRRPIQAMTPLVFIGKETERKAQEGEDPSILGNQGPIQYHRHQTRKTRPCAPELVRILARFSLRQLMKSGLARDTIIQARRGNRVHPGTCTRLAKLTQKLTKTVDSAPRTSFEN